MKKYRKINIKILVPFVILMVVVAVVFGELVYWISYSRSVDSANSLLNVCGQYIADNIQAEPTKKWIGLGPDEKYDQLEKELLSIKEEFSISDLFIYQPLLDENGALKDEVLFIFDIVSPGTTDRRKMKLGEIVKEPQEIDYIRAVFDTGQTQYAENFTPLDRELLLVAFVPLTDEDGTIYAMIGLSFPVSEVQQTAFVTSIGLVGVFVSVIVVFTSCLMLFIGRSITRPVKLLSERMNQFVTDLSTKNEMHYTPVTEIHTRDEIELMTDHFNSMAGAIVQYTKDLKTAAMVQERFKAELDVAGSIRSALSADNTYPFFVERTDFDLYASLKNTVYNSCSFCNYFLTGQNHLFIVMGESVGKTLPALLMSMLASASIRCLAGTGAEPYRIAAETNEQLCGFERNDKGMTVCALIMDIDLTDGTMKYINAGMPRMLIKAIGESYHAEEESIQFNLGEMKNVSFTQKTLELQQGYTLLLTSHGVCEMRNAEGERFTMHRLEESVNRIAKEKVAMNEMIGELEQYLNQFRQGRPTELDTTILGFRYLG